MLRFWHMHTHARMHVTTYFCQVLFLLKTLQVQMMCKSFKNTDRTSSPDRAVMYFESSAYQAVRLPYKGCTISAIAVLPSEASVQKHGLASAVADLEVEALLDRSKYRKVCR